MRYPRDLTSSPPRPTDLQAGGVLLPGLPSLNALMGTEPLPEVKASPRVSLPASGSGASAPAAPPGGDSGNGLELIFKLLGLAGATAVGAKIGGGLGAVKALGAGLQGLNDARQQDQERRVNQARVLQNALSIKDPQARLTFLRNPIFRDFLGEDTTTQIEALTTTELNQEAEEIEARRQGKIGDVRRQIGTDVRMTGGSPETVALHPELIGGPLEPQEGELAADYLKRTRPVADEYAVTSPMVEQHQAQAEGKDRANRLKALQSQARSATTPEGKRGIATTMRNEGFTAEADALDAEATGRQAKADTAAGRAQTAADLREQARMFDRADRLIRAGVPDEAANLLEAAGFPQDATALRTASARKQDKGESPFTREIFSRAVQYWGKMQKTPNPISLEQAITRTEQAVQKLQSMRGSDAGIEAAVKALQGQTPAQIESQLFRSRSLTPDQKDEVRRRLGVSPGNPLDTLKMLRVPDSTATPR